MADPRALEDYRDEFPVLARKTYLISASLGPVSDRSLALLDGYLEAWASKGAPDHVWFEDIFPRMRATEDRPSPGWRGATPTRSRSRPTSRWRCPRWPPRSISPASGTASS